MAIQFSCPDCTAVIRVPDSAAGKMGQCPQCQSQLLVPAVEIPDAEPPPAAGAPVTEPPAQATPQPFVQISPHLSGTTARPATPETRNDLPNPVDQPSIDARQPTVTQRFVRRKKSWAGILVPVTFASLLLGVLLFVFWQQAPDLTGNVRATVVDSPDLEPAIIPKSLLDVPKGTVDLTLEDLANAPLRIDTNVIESELSGTGQGLVVSVWAGVETEFFRVNLKSLADLSKYYDDHTADLAAIQDKELRDALRDLYEKWEHFSHEGIPGQSKLRYRDQIVLNALVGGLGYQLTAIARNATYRCVYERDGQFYFLLPKDTSQFEIVGRKQANEDVLFPGRYRVKVARRK